MGRFRSEVLCAGEDNQVILLVEDMKSIFSPDLLVRSEDFHVSLFNVEDLHENLLSD